MRRASIALGLQPACWSRYELAKASGSYSQSFARRDTFDIRDFAEKLKTTATADDVKASCDQIIAAFDDSRVHSAALGPRFRILMASPFGIQLPITLSTV